MSTSAASRRNGHDGARKRVGFTLGGGSGDITPIDGDGTNLNNDNILLDDQEQDNVVDELSLLSQQSMLLWRVAALLLLFFCFILYAILPLPSVPFNPSNASKPSMTISSILYRRSLILSELFLGTLSTLTEFITTLPEPSTPMKELSHVRMTQGLKQKLLHALHLPPELSSNPNDIQRLRLSAPLMAATSVAAIRTFYTIYLYLIDKRNGTGTGATLPIEDALLWSASFIVLFISFLARSYANQLDRDLGELKTLKYANKGV